MSMQENIIKWANERGIFSKATPDSQHSKTLEEVQELTDALADNDTAAIKDGIGDTAVTLTIQAHMHGWTLEDCMQAAYDEIKNRTGQMIDGVFVKDGDRAADGSRKNGRGLEKQLQKSQGVLAQIKLERGRQIVKGYDAAHDDADLVGNHARAAAYYATAAHYQRRYNVDSSSGQASQKYVKSTADIIISYPWAEGTKRVEPNARDNLVKAAALIVAEIERIDREEAAK